MKTITILSGKGGVGKSSITASLAVTLSKNKKIICADCDVDAPNLNIVLGDSKKEKWVNLSTNKKAVIDYEKCTLCKQCENECYFNAIKWEGKPAVSNTGCEGCGYCKILCPNGAITLVDIDNAKIGYSKTKYGFTVVSAQLGIGSSGSGKVVSEVKKMAKELANDSEIMLIDSSAGVGCPVIASITGSDYAIIVTEPTPSGISDMNKALEIVNHFQIPYGIVINKFDINPEISNSIPKEKVISKIPFNKIFMKALVELKPVIELDETLQKNFDEVIKYL